MSNKNIIITGGSSGIGENISEFLYAKGHKVVNLDLKKNKNKIKKIIAKFKKKKLEQVYL